MHTFAFALKTVLYLLIGSLNNWLFRTTPNVDKTLSIWFINIVAYFALYFKHKFQFYSHWDFNLVSFVAINLL